MTITLDKSKQIQRLQRIIAERLHNDSVLPTDIIIFTEKTHCKGLSSFSNPTVPLPTEEHQIADPSWKLSDCFAETQIGPPPPPITSSAKKKGNHSKTSFFDTPQIILSSPKLNDIRPDGIQLYYDIWPYTAVPDLGTFVQVFYPKHDKGTSNVDRSCSLLMKEEAKPILFAKHS
ncbi:hypothetical protein HDU99_004589 [Rhizoclosmatium hyalinum]|nr:hypothetical protein HDU99_004589 [Rhizoclosmatium hyalinum]